MKKPSYRELERRLKKQREAVQYVLSETTREITEMWGKNEILESLLEQVAKGERSKHEAAIWYAKWQKTKEGKEMDGQELAEYLEVPELAGQLKELHSIVKDKVLDVYQSYMEEVA